MVAGLLGPCFKTGRMAAVRRGPPRPRRAVPCCAAAAARAAARVAPCRASRHPLPCEQFHALFAPFPRFFSSFPHGTCSLSVSCRYLALDGMYHPLRAAFPSNPTRSGRMRRIACARGCHPLWRPVPGHFALRCAAARLVYNSLARFQNRAVPASLAATGGIPVGFFSSAY